MGRGLGSWVGARQGDWGSVWMITLRKENCVSESSLTGEGYGREGRNCHYSESQLQSVQVGVRPTSTVRPGASGTAETAARLGQLPQ